MFERFTEPARQVVVFAQEEARELKHDSIGTEHLLLGVLRERQGIAARVLKSLDITAEDVRAQVARRIVGQTDEVTSGEMPFTPRAKKVLELALQEALSLNHDFIGTEHILLALAREGDGGAARILLDLGSSPKTIAGEVLRTLGGEPVDEEALLGYPGRISRRLWLDKEASTLASLETSFVARTQLLLGWLLFAVALAVGIFVGWLIWG